MRITLVISWGHPHSADERAQHLSWRHGGDHAPARRDHPGLAADVRRETSRHRAGIATAAGGAVGLLPMDGIPSSTLVSLKLP
jgi:hypothetical protein